MISRLLKKIAANNSTALEVSSKSGNVYSISGVRRIISIPTMGINNSALSLEFDISVFKGSFKLKPDLGFSTPLFKVMVGRNTGFNLLWYTDTIGNIIKNTEDEPLFIYDLSEKFEKNRLDVKIQQLPNTAGSNNPEKIFQELMKGNLIDICVVEPPK